MDIKKLIEELKIVLNELSPEQAGQVIEFKDFDDA